MYPSISQVLDYLGLWDLICQHGLVYAAMSHIDPENPYAIAGNHRFEDRAAIEACLEDKIGNGSLQRSTLFHLQNASQGSVLAAVNATHFTHNWIVGRKALSTLLLRGVPNHLLMMSYGETHWNGLPHIYWEGLITMRLTFKVSNALFYGSGWDKLIPRETESERAERLDRQSEFVTESTGVATDSVLKDLAAQLFFLTDVRSIKDPGDSPGIACTFARRASVWQDEPTMKLVNFLFTQRWNVHLLLTADKRSKLPIIELAFDGRQDANVLAQKRLFLNSEVLDVAEMAHAA